MASSATLEGVKNTIFFPLKGKGWGVKWLIGSALCLANFIIPIVPLIPLYGYAGQIAKRVIHDDEDPELPEWKDWGLFFSDGIKLFGATAIFTLPGVLTVLVGYFLMIGMNFAFMFDPSIYTSETISPEFFIGSMGGMFAGIILMFAGMLLALVCGFFLPPALGHLIAKDDFGAAFRFKEWWPNFKANFSGYVLALVILYGVNMALVWAAYIFYFTIVLCFLMPIALCVAMFLMIVIHLSLVSVAYRDGMRKLAEG
ncbi:MAG: DUF4013 domain-containing protein [Chloroflexi bacterium]|nr:DUF4013 domain-containing protein [Chloroflexota bacterium]